MRSKGLQYMVASAFLFSIMSVLVKVAGQRLDSAQIVLARVLVALVMSYWSLRRGGISPWGTTHRHLLVLRGLLGFGGLSCYFYAVTKLPLGDASVIMYMNPIFVGLLAALFLKERVRPVELAAVALSLAGVACIAQPSFLFGEGASRLDPAAVVIALVGAFFAASAYTTVRALSGKEHPMVVVFYFPLMATPLALPYAWSRLLWPTPLEWVLLVSVGVTTQIAQILMTRGLYLERAGKATAVTLLQVVFAFLWGALLFAELPTWLSATGAVLVLLGSFVAARAEH
ncbi:MAG: DMT family transporter [Myxococcota bacterium]